MGIIYRPQSLDFFEPVDTPLILPDGSNPKGYLVPPDYLLDNISEPHHMWRYLIERIAAKKQQRILVPELEYEDITSDMLADIKLAYLSTSGGNTIYAANTGKPDCRYLPPSSGGVTKNELAREYLNVCLEEGKKRWGQVLRCPRGQGSYSQFPPALFYEGGRHRGSYAYVDISSAYWTIQKTSTIDMRYVPGDHVVTGKAVFLEADEVTRYRDLRHAVPGNLRCGEMQVSKYGVFSQRGFRGEFDYPSIIGYTMHVMHSVAREVIDHFGALMILTDAFIVPQDRAWSLIDFLWEEWGLGAVVKAKGEGALYQLGVYQLPGKRSVNAPGLWTEKEEWTYVSEGGNLIRHVRDGSAFSSLMDVDSSWLRKQRKVVLEQKLEGSLP